MILLLASAAFSGTLTALSALSEAALTKESEEGNKRSARILGVIQKPSAFRSAADLVICVSCALSGIITVSPLARGLGLWLISLGLPGGISHLLGALAALLVIISLFTVLGIHFPKRIASKYSRGWMRIMFRPAYALSLLLRPLVSICSVTLSVLVRLVGIDPRSIQENVTEEEIIMMVSEGHEQGVIEESEAEMISNIFEFDDKEVSDIMTHRRGIVSIDADMDLGEAAQLMASQPYSRYPVYEDDEDNIVGILHLKDVMRELAAQEEQDEKSSIRELMRSPFFVPETRPINSLFQEMQEKKIHMAIVVDEYGQTAGLVAMEDILEEIVGNIMDEYDQDEQFIQNVGGGWYIKGLTPLEMVEEELGIEFGEDFETLNGYLISRLDHIPKPSEYLKIEAMGYCFRIISVSDHAISLVRVTRLSSRKSAD